MEDSEADPRRHRLNERRLRQRCVFGSRTHEPLSSALERTRTGGGGSKCTITVSGRQPRFKASFAATLDLAVGQGPPTVTIESGQIDVGAPVMGCL